MGGRGAGEVRVELVLLHCQHRSVGVVDDLARQELVGPADQQLCPLRDGHAKGVGHKGGLPGHAGWAGSPASSTGCELRGAEALASSTASSAAAAASSAVSPVV